MLSLRPSRKSHLHSRSCPPSKKQNAKGKPPIQIEGKFVDYPVVEQARRVVSLAKAISG
jgi:citrate lyase beta subunit